MNLEALLHLMGALMAVTLVRGTAVFLAALAITSLARKLPCETRHLIWLGVIASFLLIPLAWLLPPLRIGAPIPLASDAPSRLAVAPVLSAREYMRLLEGIGIAGALGRSPSATSFSGKIGLALSLAWLAGILVLVARLAVGKCRLLRLAAEAGRDGRLQAAADALAGQLQPGWGIPVLLSPPCRIPLAFSLLRPRILLPQEAACWPAGRLQSALTHELAHVRRRDLAAQTAAYAVCILFWFVPPLWLAYAAMLREAETCCDQQVIDRGFRGPEYAQDILELARRCEGRLLLPSISSAAGMKSLLKQRIRRVLSLKAGRRPGGTRHAVRVLGICLACLVPLLVLSAQARPLLLPPSDPLFGTWVNAAYEGNVRRVAAKALFFPDGRELEYFKVADAEPFSAGNFRFESVWIDAEGSHCYQMAWVGDDYPRPLKNPRFGLNVLARVNAAGSRLDLLAGQDRYPEDFKDIVCGVPTQYRRQ